jgi:hypothetical protein
VTLFALATSRLFALAFSLPAGVRVDFGAAAVVSAG